MTSWFVYKVMGLTFHDRITCNTQLIYRFQLAQVVARRFTKAQRIFLGSNLTGCSFFIQFFYFYFQGGGGGGGSDFVNLFMSYFCSFNLFIFIFFIFIHLTCIRHT